MKIKYKYKKKNNPRKSPLNWIRIFPRNNAMSLNKLFFFHFFFTSLLFSPLFNVLDILFIRDTHDFLFFSSDFRMNPKTSIQLMNFPLRCEIRKKQEQNSNFLHLTFLFGCFFPLSFNRPVCDSTDRHFKVLYL